MAKLFFKTTYSVFLWILLFVNIIFVFDMPFLLQQYVNVNGGNFSDKYFGVSSLINALKSLDTLPISSFTSNVGNYMRDMWNYASKVLSTSLPDYSEVNNFWDWLVASADLLKNILQYVWGIFCYVVAMGLGFVYTISLILNLFFSILMFMSGYYYSVVPQSIIFSEENHMLLNIPLVYRFCCC